MHKIDVQEQKTKQLEYQLEGFKQCLEQKNNELLKMQLILQTQTAIVTELQNERDLLKSHLAQKTEEVDKLNMSTLRLKAKIKQSEN